MGIPVQLGALISSASVWASLSMASGWPGVGREAAAVRNRFGDPRGPRPSGHVVAWHRGPHPCHGRSGLGCPRRAGDDAARGELRHWLTLLGTVDQHLSAMPPTIAALMVSPALLPLTTSVLAAWSLSRVRHI